MELLFFSVLWPILLVMLFASRPSAAQGLASKSSEYYTSSFSFISFIFLLFIFFLCVCHLFFFPRCFSCCCCCCYCRRGGKPDASSFARHSSSRLAHPTVPSFALINGRTSLTEAASRVFCLHSFCISGSIVSSSVIGKKWGGWQRRQPNNDRSIERERVVARLLICFCIPADPTVNFLRGWLMFLLVFRSGGVHYTKRRKRKKASGWERGKHVYYYHRRCCVPNRLGFLSLNVLHRCF
jgi:hypothetical protein